MASSLGSSKIVGTGSFLLVYRRVVVHWRAIILLLILPVATVPIAYGDFFDLITLALFLLFIASQVFWIGRILDLGERFIPGKPHRAWLAIMAGLVYSFIFLYSFPEWGLGHIIRTADYRPQSMLVFAAFSWWFVGSLSAFLLMIAFGATDRAARAAGWVYRKVRTAIHQYSAAADAEAAQLSSSRPSLSGADRGASQRHSLRRSRLWASLRAARRRNRSSARTAGAPAQSLRGFSHRPAFRRSHWSLHYSGLHSPLRRHYQRIRARFDRVDRGLH